MQLLDPQDAQISAEIQQLVEASTLIGVAGAAIGSGDSPVINKRKTADTPEEEVNGDTKKRKRRTVVRDPNAPKKPLTAYFAFAAEARREIIDQREKQNLPTLPSSEMTNIISARWKDISEDDKGKFKDEYKKAWEKYAVAKAEYDLHKINDSAEIPDKAAGDSAEPAEPSEAVEKAAKTPSSPAVETPKKKKKEKEEKTPDGKKDKKKKKEKKKDRVAEVKNS